MASSQASVHEMWMDETLREARRVLDQGQIPLAALVVSDGKVISKARSEHAHIRHAEFLALDRASKNLASKVAKCTLYTVLEPCVACAGVAIQLEVDEIVFAARASPDGGVSILEDLRERGASVPSVVPGILAKEAHLLVEEFLRKFPKSQAAPYADSLVQGWRNPGGIR